MKLRIRSLRRSVPVAPGVSVSLGGGRRSGRESGTRSLARLLALGVMALIGWGVYSAMQSPAPVKTAAPVAAPAPKKAPRAY